MLLEDTVNQIHTAQRERLLRLAEARRLRRPVVELDIILAELEELHLKGGIKVPALMITRIERFLASLPVDCRAEFPLRTTIVRVMDNLYLVQDRLLSKKDQRREALRVVDVDLDEIEIGLEGGSPAA